MKLKDIAGMLGLVSLLTVNLANAATISVNPASQTVAVGDSLNLTISGAGFPDAGVTAGSILLSWDANVLQLNTTLPDSQVDGIFNTGFTDVFSFDNTLPGQLEFTAAIGIVAPPVGTFGAAFDFLNLAFTALAAPGTVANIGVGFFGDWQTADFNSVTDVTYNSASVTVSAVPVPAAVWLFGSGLLGLVAVARRRRAA